jgi:hypothetical protein
MKSEILKKVSSSFAHVLEVIIEDLEKVNSVVVPEVVAVLKSIEVLTGDAKIKEIIDAVIKGIDVSKEITPDIITLLKDLQKILEK